MEAPGIIFGWTAVQMQKINVAVELRTIPNVPRPRGSWPIVAERNRPSYFVVVLLAGTAAVTKIAESRNKK